ncbi:hypothetical protein GGF32_005874 [Allomyces javanicus]|nr:hypothetical protein GGF32_005874 [Allomyces javanicus]
MRQPVTQTSHVVNMDAAALWLAAMAQGARHDRGAPLTFPGNFDVQHWHAGSFHAVGFWDVEHPVDYFIHRATGVTWAKLVWAFPDRWPGAIDVERPPGYGFRFTAWANISGRAAYEDIDTSVYFGHVAFREAFLQYARPPYSVPGNSEEYRQHEQKYGCVGVDLDDDAQLVAMVEYSVWRVLQVMAWLWETYEETTLDYATMYARRCTVPRGYWGELEMEDNFMAHVHMAACRAIVEAWMVMPLAKAEWFGGAGGAAQLQRCEFMAWEFDG